MNNLEQKPQFCQTDVMRGYFGLPFDFKLVAENGDIIFISNTHEDFLTLSKLDLSKFKMQQFTGVIDRNKNKIYFGDTLGFVDKWEWYKGTWAEIIRGLGN